MATKKSNSLRDYHLLVTRGSDGFEWQVRYNRHANPVQRSEGTYPTQVEASAAGEVALAILRRKSDDAAP